ncbi:hypothetical protein PHSC3_000646 [Chlamydiales bacterium STE3]|nr:hypothetical protein PHSC3_000646 [Chlamydiales bacterium STE3]
MDLTAKLKYPIRNWSDYNKALIQRGKSKCRVWRKLSIGMDPDSGEIIVSELTVNGVGSGDA